MRLADVTLSAAGDSIWVIPPPTMVDAVIAMALTFSENANLTASVYYTYDEPEQTPQAVALAWAANVLTVTLDNHGLNTNDVAEISQSVTGKFNSSTTAGGPKVTVTGVNTFTIPLVGAGLPANDTAVARTYRMFEHPVLMNINGTPPARIDGNYQLGLVEAFRLEVTAWTTGAACLSTTVTKGG
jgi:hypothetical protein